MAPARREPKPMWRDVPPEIRQQIEEIAGSSIVRAVRVFGGYGPSATFRIHFANGMTMFAKGAGTTSNEVNWRMVPLEERLYQHVLALKTIAPRYFGSVQCEGWHLLLLDDLRDTVQVPPWSEELANTAVRDLARFHLESLSEVDRVPRMDDPGLVKSWRMFRDSEEDQQGFLALYRDEQRSDAKAWLTRHMDAFVTESEQLMRADQPWGLIHTDIRSDNLRFRDGHLVLFDWPSACYGPLICDVSFFAPSVAGEGGPAPRELVRKYRDHLRSQSADSLIIPKFAIRAAAAATAGYFALRAGRPGVPGLPRLREVQKLQLWPALIWAAEALGLSEPPLPLS